MVFVIGTVTDIDINQGPTNILNQTDWGTVFVKDQETQVNEVFLLWST